MREVYKLLSMCLDILNNWNGCEKSREELRGIEESREESIYEGYIEDESLKSWVEEYENG